MISAQNTHPLAHTTTSAQDARTEARQSHRRGVGALGTARNSLRRLVMGLTVVSALLTGCQSALDDQDAVDSSDLSPSVERAETQPGRGLEGLRLEGRGPRGSDVQTLGGCDPHIPNCTRYGTGEENIYPPDLFYSALTHTFMLAYLQPASAGYSLMVNRLSAGGAALDGSGVALATLSGDVYGKRTTAAAASPSSRPAPVVTAGADGFLVVFQSQGANDLDIFAVQVPYEGAIGRSPVITVSAQPGNQHSPSVVSNGNGYLVSWVDERNGEPALYATMMDERGGVQNREGLKLVAGSGAVSHPVVASDGEGFLAVFEQLDRDGRSVLKALALDEQGATGDKPLDVSELAGNQTHPSIAAGADGYLVAFERQGEDLDIQATFLSRAGEAQWTKEVSDAAMNQTLPEVAFDGRDFLVGFGSQLRGGSFLDSVLLSFEGDVLSKAALAPSIVAGSGPALASNGEEFLAVYKAVVEGEVGIFGVLY